VCTGWAKNDIFSVLEFPLLFDALYLQFLFTNVSLSLNNVVHSLPMYDIVNMLCFLRMNYNFATMVGLTNNERCVLIMASVNDEIDDV